MPKGLNPINLKALGWKDTTDDEVKSAVEFLTPILAYVESSLTKS
jgi:hypothetical protein